MPSKGIISYGQKKGPPGEKASLRNRVCRTILKVQLHRQLLDSRKVQLRFWQLPEGDTSETRVRTRPLHVVGQVERLGTELQPVAFADRNHFLYTEINERTDRGILN